MTESALSSSGTNSGRRLLSAVSPYLKQLADSQVDWYQWGQEAFAAAAEQNKPVFLSVGYFTCYWCHVMEHDVFRNEEIAAKMNEYFVNIKVDREVRPEVDEIYMTARQLITQQNGWPNNLFLTPDMKPFYAVGTMASDGRYGHISFPELLDKVHDSWVNDRKNVLETAEKTTVAIGEVINCSEDGSDKRLDSSLADRLFTFMTDHYDEENGGFFDEPRFPHEPYLQFLLDYGGGDKNSESVKMVRKSLEGMLSGAMFDHVGGGFHRYTTDSGWIAPHFEKMLYRQALTVICYSELYGIRRLPAYERAVARTLDFVTTEMKDDNGGFYSAIDAETNGIEGAYYVWREEEISSVLSVDEQQAFFEYFALAELPEVPGHKKPEGKSLYATAKWRENLAIEDESEYTKKQREAEALLGKLKSLREEREKPHIDTKIITSWNGLIIQALAVAGQMFSSSEYIKQAEAAAEFILKNSRLEDGSLARIYSDGNARHSAYLEDYGFLVSGLLALYKVDERKEWLHEATQLMEQADSLFLDDEHGTYFFTDGKSKMISRIRKASDSVLPSCSGVMVSSFLDLHEITKEEKWLERARRKLLAYSGAMNRNPTEYASMVQALNRMRRGGLL